MFKKFKSIRILREFFEAKFISAGIAKKFLINLLFEKDSFFVWEKGN